jgi:UDP-3-O-[3-hydroxymyristoyl] N-acetylglucosamine deacetylase
MPYQQTIKQKATFSGVGLHSGRQITLTVRPAIAGTGIVFHRVDLPQPVTIEARSEHVVNTRLSTTIGRDGAVVATIEHLMAALYTTGIDNAHIDIDGAEVPIMDGSAQPFIDGISVAGVAVQSRPRTYLVVKRPVMVTDGDKRISLVPSRSFRISFDMHFSHPAVSSQFRSMRFDQNTFAAHYAPARTFGFLAEVEMLKANGLALGGSLDNAIVIGDQGVLNPEGLRFDDEFVRHKILDSVGDLYLAGYRIRGHVKSLKAGHDLNHKLVSALLAAPESWRLEELVATERPASPRSVNVSELAWSEA